MPKEEPKRSCVVIELFAEKDRLIDRCILSYDEYYDDPHEIIDSPEYRAANKVRRLSGTIFDSHGNTQSQFDNRYDEQGELIHRKQMLPDGTINETSLGK